MDSGKPKSKQTPYGVLYAPHSHWTQAAVLLGVFAGNAGMAKCCALWLGTLSTHTQNALYLPFFVIFFGGYALWVSYLKALAFDLIGRRLWVVLFNWLFRRKKPRSLEEVMPSQDQLLKAAVGAQKGARGFVFVSFPVGFVSGILAMGIDSKHNFIAEFFILNLGCIAWGVLLSLLGRRGYLPILEDGS